MIPRENNDKLCEFGRRWRLDGDWLVCQGCMRQGKQHRPLIASRDGEPACHVLGCKNADSLHPWSELRALLGTGDPS